MIGREETVGYHPDNKRRNHGSDCYCSVGETYLNSIEMKGLSEIGSHGNIPTPPDKKLYKHHRRQFVLHIGKIHYSLN